MSAVRYGFQPMPEEGLTIRQKLVIAGGIALLALAGLTLALSGQFTSEDERLKELWSKSWAWPERYHLRALDHEGGEWEIWFQAPQSWLVKSPTGFQVSDGTTVTTYHRDGNYFTRNPVNSTYLQGGIGPLGPRESAELKRVLQQTLPAGR